MIVSHLICAHRRSPKKMPPPASAVKKLVESGELVLVKSEDAEQAGLLKNHKKDAYGGKDTNNFGYSEDYLKVSFKEPGSLEFIYDRGSAEIFYQDKNQVKHKLSKVRGVVQTSKNTLLMMAQTGVITKISMNDARVKQESQNCSEEGINWMSYCGNSEYNVRIGYQSQGACMVVPNDEIRVIFDLIDNKKLTLLHRESCQALSTDMVIGSTILIAKQTPVLVYFWSMSRELNSMAIIKGRLHKLPLKLKLGVFVNLVLCPGPKSYIATKKCLSVLRNRGLGFKWQQYEKPPIVWLSIKLKHC